MVSIKDAIRLVGSLENDVNGAVETICPAMDEGRVYFNRQTGEDQGFIALEVVTVEKWVGVVIAASSPSVVAPVGGPAGADSERVAIACADLEEGCSVTAGSLNTDTFYDQAAAEALAESVRSTVDGMEQVLRMGDCWRRRVVLFETKNYLRDALLKYQAARAFVAAQEAGGTDEQTVEDAAAPETPESHTDPGNGAQWVRRSR